MTKRILTGIILLSFPLASIIVPMCIALGAFKALGFFAVCAIFTAMLIKGIILIADDGF